VKVSRVIAILVRTGVSVSTAFLPVMTHSYTDQLEICTPFGRCCPSRPACSEPASPGCAASLTVVELWTALDIVASWRSTSVTARKLSVRIEGLMVGTIKKSTGTWCSEVWDFPNYQPSWGCYHTWPPNLRLHMTVTVKLQVRYVSKCDGVLIDAWGFT